MTPTQLCIADRIAKTVGEPATSSASQIWHVRAEDPNTDLHGPHGNPTLGYVRGTFEQALAWAFAQKGFIAWGSGGKIELVTVQSL